MAQKLKNDKPNMTRPKLKLGKLPKRTDPRTLQFRNYLETPMNKKLTAYEFPEFPPPPVTMRKVPAAPPTQDWIMQTPRWPMYDNDALGDCVIAAAAHSIGQRTYLSSKSEAILTDAEIIAAYGAVGGYVPGDPATDQGCDMLTACKYWQKTGFAGHQIAAFVEVDPKNAKEINQAIWLFGNLYVGVALPVAVQNQNYWIAPPNLVGDWTPGSWGGHCIPIMSYNRTRFACVTWGQRLDMARGFITAYCDEAYATLSTEWIEKNGIAVSGFNLAKLQADLAAL